MDTIRYRIINESPLLIVAKYGDMNLVATEPYIPGTTVLGMLVKQFFTKKQKVSPEEAYVDEEFYNWFLAGQITISNAYILSKNTTGTEFVHFPVPLSIQKEKYESHVYDLLYVDEHFDKQTQSLGTFCVAEAQFSLNQNSFLLMKQAGVPEEIVAQLQSLEGEEYADKNGLILDIEDEIGKEHADRYAELIVKYAVSIPPLTFLQTRNVPTALNFHHARDRVKGITKEGGLFTYQSIAPHQTFEGALSGEKSVLEAFTKCCGSGWSAYLGRSKNAQYGKVRVEIQPNQSALYRPEMQWENKINSSGTIVLTLLSDTILYNDAGFSTTDVSELEKQLGVTVVKAFVKTGKVETFLSIWRLKTPSEVCFLAGSSFLLDVSELSEDTRQRLTELQQTGLGERTYQGFGKCLLGWQTQRDLGEREETQDQNFQPAKPQFPIPGKTNAIIKTIVAENLKKQVEAAALHDLRDFSVHKLPSNALIGRLSGFAKMGVQRPCVKLIERSFKLLKASFKLTEQSFEELRDENIPKDILETLKPLENRKILDEEKFLEVITKQIGEDKTVRYKTLILKHAEHGVPEEALNNLRKIEKHEFREEREFLKAVNQHIGRQQYVALILKYARRGKFLEAIEGLRRSAVQQLERCHGRKETLLQILLNKDKDLTITELFKKSENTGLKKLCKRISYDAEHDYDLENTLYWTYFSTLFAMMRKLTKTQKEK